jgi:hypothetical protein
MNLIGRSDFGQQCQCAEPRLPARDVFQVEHKFNVFLSPQRRKKVESLKNKTDVDAANPLSDLRQVGAGNFHAAAEVED